MNAFLHRYWAVGLMLVATLFYAVTYVPAAFYEGINSDELQVLMFYHDVFQAGHSARGWLLPGASDLFPDWSLCFVLYTALGNGLEADVVLQVTLFLSWLILFFILYRLYGGPRPEVFLPLLVLVSVLAIHNNLSHIGAMLDALAGLCLTFFAGRKRSVARFFALGTVCFLGATSDPLFLVIFAVPAVFALAVKSHLRPENRGMDVRLIGAIGFGAVTGYAGSSVIFPVPTARGSYTQFHPENILSCLQDIWRDLSPEHHFWLTLLVTADLLIFLSGIMTWWKFRQSLRQGSPVTMFLLAYTFFLVALNWSALVLSNNWSPRYVYFPLIWPPILAAILVSRFFPRGVGLPQLLALGVGIYTAGLSLRPLPVSPEYVAALQRVQDLRALMAREHLQAGFAEYWIAGITTCVSRDTVCLRPMAGTSFYHWVSNSEWVRGDDHDAPPRFRYLIPTHLDPVALRARFGPPDKIAETSLHEPVWIYSEANAISYNPMFGELGNRHTYPEEDQATFAAAALSSETGQLQGTARIAREGRDRVGCFTFGPYIHIQPGRYRADYAYRYLKPPAAAKPVVFDCVLRLEAENYLDRAALPYVDQADRVLSRTFVVPTHPDGAMLELRLHYFGSGDIEVDSLHLTRLGPG